MGSHFLSFFKKNNYIQLLFEEVTSPHKLKLYTTLKHTVYLKSKFNLNHRNSSMKHVIT